MNQRIQFTTEQPTQNEGKTEKTAAELIKEGILKMEETLYDVPEEDRESFERNIQRKLKSGQPLTAKELNYLRIHNPELYRTAIRVEQSRKNLKTQLKNCRSKEAVQNVIGRQFARLKAMKNDPDREYMAAMIQREIDEFKKSSAYARLPEKEKDVKGSGKKISIKNRKKQKPSDEMLLPVITQSYKQNEILSEQLQKLA